MKKIAAVLIAVVLVTILLTGCESQAKSKIEYTKYSDTFFDSFDTLTRVVIYARTQEEFNAYFEKIRARFSQLHKLYDIYNDYDGINNIKTINDNAGIKPVKVDKEVIDLILFAKEWYGRTEGRTNIAMGSVLEIWHDYRTEGMDDPLNAKLPPMEQLKEAAKHTDISKVIVDTKNSTVYLEDKKMSLDVGAVAKGFATELVTKEMMAEGLTSGIISAGGNVRVIGKPLDGIRDRFGIGIQDPDQPIISDEDNTLDTVFLNNKSVVSSGDYERYYVVNGEKYHHLIDPDTLMPGNFFKAVTIITEDSGTADLLSTAVFLLPYEKSRRLVEGLNGVEALWVMPDGKIEVTEGMKNMMKSNGASSVDKK